MSDNNTRELTAEEIAAIIRALAAVVVQTKNKSSMIDSATNEPSTLDEFHKLNAAERTTAEELIDLLDQATSVTLELAE
ncbi:MAG: hypothetical protein ACLPID_12355 [Beijerinckiaceae bacterium]